LLRPIDIVFPAGSFGAPEETTIRTGAKLGAMVNAQIAQLLTQLGQINLNVRIKAGREIARGGPLWPLVDAQIGGLTVATFVTLVIVPVIYASRRRI
jgi:Cu/Ag efflux pump CusA